MQNLPFNTLDSWALWDEPAGDISQLDDETRQNQFGEAYQPNHFPKEQLPADLASALSEVKFVLVGLNPGSAGVTLDEQQEFLNFHGQKKSLDYRLAAAVYGTPLWGAFMTDLVAIDESNSENVVSGEAEVQALEDHLDQLGIPAEAVLVGLGTKAATTLRQFAQRPVEKLPHYSGANGHWKAANTRQAVLKMLKNINNSTR